MILTLIALLAAAQDAPDNDLFIGTLERDGGALVLRGCDLAENRYTLVDASSAHALDAIRNAKLPA